MNINDKKDPNKCRSVYVYFFCIKFTCPRTGVDVYMDGTTVVSHKVIGHESLDNLRQTIYDGILIKPDNKNKIIFLNFKYLSTKKI